LPIRTIGAAANTGKPSTRQCDSRVMAHFTRVPTYTLTQAHMMITDPAARDCGPVDAGGKICSAARNCERNTVHEKHESHENMRAWGEGERSCEACTAPCVHGMRTGPCTYARVQARILRGTKYTRGNKSRAYTAPGTQHYTCSTRVSLTVHRVRARVFPQTHDAHTNPKRPDILAPATIAAKAAMTFTMTPPDALHTCFDTTSNATVICHARVLAGAFKYELYLQGRVGS
jgi:hypothetical protein